MAQNNPNWRSELGPDSSIKQEIQAMTVLEVQERLQTISDELLMYELGLLHFGDNHWVEYMHEADRRYLLGYE